jgi:hypothetical protein
MRRQIDIRQHLYALAFVLLVSGCAADSLEWQRRTENDFPARVNWITSQVGNILDTERGLRYGSWTVTSGAGGPYATYQCPQGGICEVNIGNLQCQQSTGGPAPCALVLYKNAICELVIPEKRETLEIGCPIQVVLKPKGKDDTVPPEQAAAAPPPAAKKAEEPPVAPPPQAKRAEEPPAAPPPQAKKAEEPPAAPPPLAKGAEQAPAAPPPAAKGAEQAAALAPAEAKAAATQRAAAAAASEQAKGQSVAGDFVVGVRAGAIVPTQQILENLSSGTSAGPLVNVEAYYVLREWVRLGLMFEWHRYNINGRDAEVGTLTTFSFLPAVEFRPTRDIMRNNIGFEWLIPYASFGAGLNVHSFSNGARLGNDSVSFSNTFALRVAGGLDFPITSNLAVNGEVAWKRDSGDFERSGLNGDFNASSLMFLFGLRFHF